jgi:hypothetical protein
MKLAVRESHSKETEGRVTNSSFSSNGIKKAIEFGPKFQKMRIEIVLKTTVFQFVPEIFTHSLCLVLNFPKKIG